MSEQIKAVLFVNGGLPTSGASAGDLSALDTTVQNEISDRQIDVRRTGILPLVNVAGFPNSITADFAPDEIDSGAAGVASNTKVLLTPTQTNTTAGATLQVSGDIARDILTQDGEQIPSGFLVPGRPYVLRTSAGSWHILSGGVTETEYFDISEGLTAATLRNGYIYNSRQDAIDRITATPVPSGGTRIITIEGNALVVRGRGDTADDPLFASGDTWGVRNRIDPASGDAALAQNIGKMFPNRAGAVSAGQENLPASYVRILTIEGPDLVFRSPANSTDDPLFATDPYWGVSERFEIGGLGDNIGKIFPNRDSAFNAGQDALPFNYIRIITIEGKAIVFRSPANSTDDPLFATDPYWGVSERFDLGALESNIGKIFVSRAQAVNVGQEAIPASYRLIATLEPHGLVIRTPGTGSDDLFPDHPYWGNVQATLGFTGEFATVDALEAEEQARLAAVSNERSERMVADDSERADRIAADTTIDNARLAGDNNLQNQIDNISTGFKIVGDWDPSTGAFPTTRPDSTAIQANDQWNVTGTGTVDGVSFAPGDVLTALVDGGGATYDGNWSKRTGTASSADQITTRVLGKYVQHYLDRLGENFATRAEAQSATIPAVVETLTIDGLKYKRDVVFNSKAALFTDGDTVSWMPRDDWSPRHFGAVADFLGKVDDTPAFNRMWDAVRDFSYGSEAKLRPIKIVGGPYVYYWAGSQNVTRLLTDLGLRVEGLYAYAEVFDKSLIDMAETRFTTWRDIYIQAGDSADPTTHPWTCFSLARAWAYDDNGEPIMDNQDPPQQVINPCKYNHFYNVFVDGYFRGAAYHNAASEEILGVGCYWWNRRVADGSTTRNDPTYAPSFAVIFDAFSAIHPKSDYADVLMDIKDSFSMNQYDSCKFQKPFGIAGPTVYLDGMTSAHFNKCYITNGGGSAIEWHLRQQGDNKPERGVEFNGLQVETHGNNRVIEFVPEEGDLLYRVYGLKVTTGNLFVSDEVFYYPPGVGTGSVRINGLELDLPNWQSGVPINGIFNDRSKFELPDTDIAVVGDMAVAFGEEADYGQISGKVLSYADGSVRYLGDREFGGYVQAGTGFLDSNGVQVVGDQQPVVNNVGIGATAGTLPIADGSVTFADANNPTVQELLEAIVELQNTQANLTSMLKAHGLIAST